MNSVQRSEVPEEFRTLPNRATDRQKQFVHDLLDQRVVPDNVREAVIGFLDRNEYSKEDASKAIERLQALPRKTSQHGRLIGEMPQVGEGRYALVYPTPEGPVVKFYRVRHGKPDTRWDGFMFLDSGRGGAHGDLQWAPIKDVAHKKQVIDLIKKNPQEAGQRFGREVGVCCHCGRSLTQEHTRARGSGDDCFAAKGW